MKLMESGFEEADRRAQPGILTNADDSIRAYRVIGADFWSYVGEPNDPVDTEYVFLEMLIALAKALKQNQHHTDIESALNERLDVLAEAIRSLRFPKESLPDWIKAEFTATELTWLAAALSVFYDTGDAPRTGRLA